jgi:hypothetical protein
MVAATQLPRQQSASLVHSHMPELHRLLRAMVHPSFAGSAQVLPPPSNAPNSPPSPLELEPLQLPVQQPLLSLHGSSTPAQQVTATKTSHTAPFGPASNVVAEPTEPPSLQGSPVAAIESKAKARHGTRRFIVIEA